MAARILIVDDDLATQVGMTTLLQRAGYDAQGVASFVEARQALRGNRPDLLITDVRLGEYNGLQLLVGAQDPIPTIVVTAYQDPVLEAEARAHGAWYLLKPITPGHLLATIEQILSGGASAPTRRWARKRLVSAVSAELSGTPAWVVDISYGGLRVEFENRPVPELPRTLMLELSGVSVPVDVVWQRPMNDGCACGLAVVATPGNETSGWHGLVDAIH